MKVKKVSGRAFKRQHACQRQNMIRQMNRISDVEIAAPEPAMLFLPRKPAAAVSDTRQDSNRTSAATKHAIANAERAVFEGAGEGGAGGTAGAESESKARESSISSSISSSRSSSGSTRSTSSRKSSNSSSRSTATTTTTTNTNTSSTNSSSDSQQEGLMLGCHQDVQTARQPSPGAVATVRTGNVSPVEDHATTHSSSDSIPTDGASCFCAGHEVVCGKGGGRGDDSTPKRRSTRRRSMRMPRTAAAAVAAAVLAVSEHASEGGDRRFSPLRKASSADTKEEDNHSETSHCPTSIKNTNNSGGEELLLIVPVSTTTTLGKHPLKRRRSSRRSSMSVGWGASAALPPGELRGAAALRRFNVPPAAPAAVVRNSSLKGANCSGASGKEDLFSVQEESPRRRSRRTSSMGASREAPSAGLTVAATTTAVVGDASAEAFIARPNVEATVETTTEGGDSSGSSVSASIPDNAALSCGRRQGVTAFTPSHEEQPKRCSTQTKPSPVSARRLSLNAGQFEGAFDPTLGAVDLNLGAVAGMGGSGAGGDGGRASGDQRDEEKAAAREGLLPERRSSTRSMGEVRASVAGRTSSEDRASSPSRAPSTGRTSLEGRSSSEGRGSPEGRASSAGRASPEGRTSSATRASSASRLSSASKASSASKVRVSPGGGSPVVASKPPRSPAPTSPRVKGATQTDRSCTGQRDTPAQKRPARRRTMRCSAKSAADEEAGGMAAALVRPSDYFSVDGVKAGCLGGHGRTGVIADVINEAMHRLEATATPPEADGVSRLLRSLLVEMVTAETCAVQHERKAAEAGAVGKRVRFCSFDFSTIDMPWDTADGSELAAAEVAKCLERVTEAQQRVQEALQGFKGEGGGDGHGIASWKAFLCELRALSVSDGVGPTVLGARQGCLATGDGGGGRGTRQQKRGFDDSAAAAAAAVRGDLSKGARFLLAELVPLEGVQVPAKNATRERLASMLSSLLRFKLRILFNPPPEPLSVSDAAVVDRRRFPGRSAGIPPPTHFSKVHEVVELTPHTAKRKVSKEHPYDHTRNAAPNAAFSRALRWLHGYSNEKALALTAKAEAFWTGIGGSGLAEEEAVELAGQHAIAVADVAGAVRARVFVRALLELQEVEEAVVQAGGWRDVEKLASALKGLMGSVDIDQSLTLLSDVDELKTWLGAESHWQHGRRAESIVQKLLMLLVPLSEQHKRRWMTAEAYQRLRENVSDVQSRFYFPTVTKLPNADVGDAAPAAPSDAANGGGMGEFDHQHQPHHHRKRAPTPKKVRRKRSSIGGKPVAVSSWKDGDRRSDQALALAEEPLQNKPPARSKRRRSIM